MDEIDFTKMMKTITRSSNLSLGKLQMKIKKLSDDAIIPTKNQGDAGYDLYATDDFELHSFQRALFGTDIAMEIPEGYYGRIADRSGNAFKKGIHVMAGVIDSTYRGNIGVVLVNLNVAFNPNDEEIDEEYPFNVFNLPVSIKKGDRIAQIIFEKYHEFDFEEVDELPESTRGEKGWGASGQ